MRWCGGAIWALLCMQMAGTVPLTDIDKAEAMPLIDTVSKHETASLTQSHAATTTTATQKQVMEPVHVSVSHNDPHLDKLCPEYWFLNEAEIFEARDGHVREHIPPFTSGNKVELMQDGAEYIESLYSDLEQTEAGDFAHLAVYHVDNKLVMKPTIEDVLIPKSTIRQFWDAAWNSHVNSSHSNVEHVLHMATDRSVDVKLLVSGWSALWSPFTMYFGMQDLPVVLDKRYPTMGSHHQKISVLSHHNNTYAYVGGLDLAPDRWDRSDHNLTNPLKGAEEGGNQISWHDLSVRIEGPATIDVERTLFERWNQKDDPDLTKPVPTAYEWRQPQITQHAGTVHVQSLRTYTCTYDHYDFAPKGERTILHAMLKAIRRAEKFIYIESPFITSEEIADELIEALPRVEKIVILTVPSRAVLNLDKKKLEEKNKTRAAVDNVVGVPDVSFVLEESLFEGLDFYTEQWMRRVTNVTGYEDKVSVYFAKNTDETYIYVHAKVMIVDDVYAILGSQNINRRSMTYDSEYSVGMVDEAGREGEGFVKSIRKKLWGEHLNKSLDDPMLDDITASLAEWETQAQDGTQRPRYFHMEPTPPDFLTKFLSKPNVWALWEPEGRCGRADTLTDERAQALLATSTGADSHNLKDVWEAAKDLLGFGEK